MGGQVFLEETVQGAAVTEELGEIGAADFLARRPVDRIETGDGGLVLAVDLVAPEAVDLLGGRGLDQIPGLLGEPDTMDSR